MHLSPARYTCETLHRGQHSITGNIGISTWGPTQATFWGGTMHSAEAEQGQLTQGQGRDPGPPGAPVNPQVCL